MSCFVRVPSLSSYLGHEYFYLDFWLFKEYYEEDYAPYLGIHNVSFGSNSVPLNFLKRPLENYGAERRSSGMDYFLDDKYFKEAKEKAAEKSDSKLLEILKEIEALECKDGALDKYKKFIDSLSTDSCSGQVVYNFCADKNTDNNKKLYNQLVELVNKCLVPLGRKLNNYLLLKYGDYEKEDFYLKFILLSRTKWEEGMQYDADQNQRFIEFWPMVRLGILTWHYASIAAYLEYICGYGNLFYCKEYDKDAKYEYFYKELDCVHDEDCKAGSTVIEIKPGKRRNDGAGYYYHENNVCLVETNIINNPNNSNYKRSDCNGECYSPIRTDSIIDVITYILKSKLEYLLSKNPELLEKKDELPRKLREKFEVKYDAKEFNNEDLNSIGICKCDLDNVVKGVMEKLKDDCFLKQIVEDVIRETKENSKIKELVADVENIIRNGVDKIVSILIEKGNKEKLTTFEVSCILAKMVYSLEPWHTRSISSGDLIMKLEYKINKFIHDECKKNGVSVIKLLKLIINQNPASYYFREYLIGGLGREIRAKLLELVEQERESIYVRMITIPQDEWEYITN